MNDLVEFLLARIGEDEEAASEVHTENCELFASGWDEGWCTCKRSARALAKCEAKRRIVIRYRVRESHYGKGNRMEARVLDWTLRLLALPYAYHPAYRDEWRP